MTNLIKPNLDVMHIEKKSFNIVFNKVMDFEGKMKVNLKANLDLSLLCNQA